MSADISEDVENGDRGIMGKLDSEKLWGWINALREQRELNSDGTVRTIVYTTVLVAPYQIGDAFNGGVIFQIYGRNVLVADNNDLTDKYPWTPSSDPYPYTGVAGTSNNNGTGQNNTNLIVSALGAGDYAAKACDDLTIDGYSDWYLPSSTEITTFHQYSGVIGYPIEENGNRIFRWSSSQFPIGTDKVRTSASVGPGGATSSTSDKNTELRVRPIRTDVTPLNVTTSSQATVTDSSNIVEEWENYLTVKDAWNVIEKINTMARKYLPKLVFDKVLENKLKLI